MSFAFSVVYNTAILRPYPSCAPIKAGHIWTRWLGVTYSVILDQKLLSCKAGHFNGRSYNYHSEFGHCIYTALSIVSLRFLCTVYFDIYSLLMRDLEYLRDQLVTHRKHSVVLSESGWQLECSRRQRFEIYMQIRLMFRFHRQY